MCHHHYSCLLTCYLHYNIITLFWLPLGKNSYWVISKRYWIFTFHIYLQIIFIAIEKHNISFFFLKYNRWIMTLVGFRKPSPADPLAHVPFIIYQSDIMENMASKTDYLLRPSILIYVLEWHYQYFTKLIKHIFIESYILISFSIIIIMDYSVNVTYR